MLRSFVLSVLFGSGCLLATGCGDSVEGVPLSGTVTFNGEPVPAGRIYFDPRGPGAQGVAEIRDGKYDTSDGRVAPTGPVTIRIEGFTAADGGKPLFKHQIEANLTEGETTQNFEVPAAAARNVPGQPSPPV